MKDRGSYLPAKPVRFQARKRRTRQRILLDVLEASLNLKKKVRIMHDASLNSAQFNSHFQELLQKGFIEKVKGSDGTPSYLISERGHALLAALRHLEEIMAPQGN